MTATTTDTEPEMREFNLGPIGSDKKLKKQQKVRRDKDTFSVLFQHSFFRPFTQPVKQRRNTRLT